MIKCILITLTFGDIENQNTTSNNDKVDNLICEGNDWRKSSKNH